MMSMGGMRPGVWPGSWSYPDERYYYYYYYGWWERTLPEPTSDREVKAMVADQLKSNSHTKDVDIRRELHERRPAE